MKTIVIATNNKNKVKEFASLFNNPNIEFKTLKEIGYNKEIIEDGTSFKENAYIKAHQVSRDLNLTAISDDSGLCCDGLDGAPGIYSARYSTTGLDEDNNKLLLEYLKNIKNRNAHYTCAICICHPDGSYKIVEEICEGIIIDEYRGSNGFGYDPIFYIPEFDKTFAEVPLNKKNEISHRAKAIRKAKELVDENFDFK